MASIVVHDRRIRYRDAGQGGTTRERRTLLFLHGAGASSAVWVRVANRLDAHGNVLAVDLPAHGRSQGPALIGVDGLATFALATLDAFGIERAVLLGHSMGGLAALRAADLSPARVEALVLVTTGARIPAHPLVYASLDRAPSDARRLMAHAAFAGGADAGMVEMAMASWPYCTGDVARADFEACDAFDGTGLAPGLGMPALVVTASEDRITPPALGASLASALPRARLCEIGGAGHMLPVEQPAALALAIETFLRELPS